MDWEAVLRDRLAEPANQVPYRLAVAVEGHPLPWDRRITALAETLAVEPRALIDDLQSRFTDNGEQVERLIGHLAGIADQACGLERTGIRRDDGSVHGSEHRRRPQPIPRRPMTVQAKAYADQTYDNAVKRVADNRQFMQIAGVGLLRQAAEMSPDPGTLRMISEYATSYIRLMTQTGANIDNRVREQLWELVLDIAATQKRDARQNQRPATALASARARLRVPAWRSHLSPRSGRGE